MKSFICDKTGLYQYDSEINCFKKIQNVEKSSWIVNLNGLIYVKVNDEYIFVDSTNYIHHILYYRDEKHTIVIYRSRIYVVDDSGKEHVQKIFNKLIRYNNNIQHIHRINDNEFFIHDIVGNGLQVKFNPHNLWIVDKKDRCLTCCSVLNPINNKWMTDTTPIKRRGLISNILTFDYFKS